MSSPTYTLNTALTAPTLPQDQYKLAVTVSAVGSTANVFVLLPADTSDPYIGVATLAQLHEIPAQTPDAFGPVATGTVVGVVTADKTQAYLVGSPAVTVGAAAQGCTSCAGTQSLVPFVRTNTYTFTLRRKDDADDVIALINERLAKLSREIGATAAAAGVYVTNAGGTIRTQ